MLIVRQGVSILQRPKSRLNAFRASQQADKNTTSDLVLVAARKELHEACLNGIVEVLKFFGQVNGF